MSREYGPKQAVYPLDADIVGRSHSWPTYNLTGSPPKLSLEEKKGLTYGIYFNGLWSNDGEYVNPADVNAGRVIIDWSSNPKYSDFHGAVDLRQWSRISRPIKVKNALAGTVVRVLKSSRSRGQSSVWVESKWRNYKVLCIYQHLDNKYLTKLGKELCTGEIIGHVGYLTIRGVDNSHLHLECISKNKFYVPENMRLVCDSKTSLRSQFDYDRLESVGTTGKHFMYNPIYLVDWINGLV
jgi:hypothetical protein